MEGLNIEKELEELETRMERLRALYEQHFMGIEKLEPLVPRRDVDRRIWVLRREQIRNTGMRFKFQMLIQRYNTYQQYWGRILREIDAGTYRRDVMRAAKRFGAQDALTILGKKRAQKYANLALMQEARRDAAVKANKIEELSDDDLLEEPPEEEMLEDDDLEDVNETASDDFDEEPPTPVPMRRRSPEEADAFLSAALASAGETTGRSAAAGLANPSAGSDKRPPVIPTPRQTDPEAARRRLAELAARGRSHRSEASAAGSTSEPLELDLDFDAPRTVARSPGTSSRKASTAKMAAMKPPSLDASSSPSKSGSSGRRPSTKSMQIPKLILEDLKDVRGSELRDPASPTESSTPRPAPPEAAPPAETAPAAARARPSPQTGRASPPRDRGLEEARLREIYDKYIETKRAAKEPTAGLTFEKLADSLRAQATKLRASHPRRSIDYDVVVKDGKTLIKPILK